MSQPIFTAVPLEEEKGTEGSKYLRAKLTPFSSFKKFFVVVLSCVCVTAVLRSNKMKFWKKFFPTLSPGGGRDWSLDFTKNMILSKHNPELALGSLPLDYLVLTSRVDENAIRFPLDDLKRLQQGEEVSLIPLCLQIPDYVGTFEDWDYMFAGISDDKRSRRCGLGLEDTNLVVQYVDNNFIVIDGKWALDVSFWSMTPGNTVNFVKAVDHPKKHWWKKKPKTFEYGGGRDWVLNLDDGTISSKHYPSLVLGKGPKALLIVGAETDEAWKFDFNDLVTLKNGGVIKAVNSMGDAAFKKEDHESYFKQFRYIQSRVCSTDSSGNEEYAAAGAVKLKYIDDNYLAIYEENEPEEKALVLDVSFWSMVPYNIVNYVGGWSYRND